jgi:hypothetical protein
MMTASQSPRFLPPSHHPARWLAYGLMIAGPLLIGLLTILLGQDANWDLRNYHWYNAYAFLNGRYGFDLLPSQTPWFYNPTLDVPYFLLANAVPMQLAAFVLGAVQGLNFVLLFLLAHAALNLADPWRKTLACGALAALGMLGGGGIAQLGTVFYDNVTSLGIFLSALLVIKFLPRRVGWMLLAGIPAGMMMGLKLPSVIFCVGLCGALLFVPTSPLRRLLLAMNFGIGVLIGIAITYAHWGWFLQTQFGSPMFPYFNNLFQSPLAPLTSARDMQFLPQDWLARLLFPFSFTANPKLVGEVEWRDWRIAIWYGLMALVAGAGFIKWLNALRHPRVGGGPRVSLNGINSKLVDGRLRGHDAESGSLQRQTITFLLTMAALSYAAWLLVFAIYRYAIPLEMLAPLLIVLLAGMLPVPHKARTVTAVALLLVVALSVQPGDWTRQRPWLKHPVEAEIPPLGDTSNLMILMAGFEPYSHLIPSFPPEVPFVRIQSNFASPDEDKGINQRIQDRIAGHPGRFMLLIPPWQYTLADQALRHLKLTLKPQTCQKVRDKLYDEYQLDLCNVARL